VTHLVLTGVIAWALAWLMHWWPRLPSRWRRRISIATSVAGVAFLIAGTESEGLREGATTSMVVLGATTLTATSSASASLYYYVLTAACLLLGFGGLVFGEPLARFLSRRWLLSAAAVAWLVTVVRFLLEKSAAPAVLTQAVSVTWAVPVAGAFIAVSLTGEAAGTRVLVHVLVRYAYLVRGFVALVATLATRLHLGTHYDASPLLRVPLVGIDAVQVFESGSWSQVFWLTLVPQLLIWPAFTVGAGLLGAETMRRLRPSPGRRRAPARLSSDALVSRERN
jgi:hypothetical protein